VSCILLAKRTQHCILSKSEPNLSQNPIFVALFLEPFLVLATISDGAQL
jgi:hypothetical protein